MVRLTTWVLVLAGTAVWLWSGVGWDAGAEPAVQAMAVVRAVAAVLATYLLVATALAVVGAAARIPVLGALAPRGVRRLVAGALAGTLLVAPGVAGAAQDRPVAEPAAGVEAPVLRRIDPPQAVPGAADPAAAAPVARERIVELGDHLWRIAETEMATRLGRAPTDAEVIPYWRQLIDANRQVAPDPDLVHPGDRLHLPS